MYRVVIMAYVVLELARHPECQESILADLSHSSTSPVSSESLRNAIHAESFIREVLRLKGETVIAVRSPRTDVELAGYCIPRGTLDLDLSISAYPARQLIIRLETKIQAPFSSLWSTPPTDLPSTRLTRIPSTACAGPKVAN